MKPTKLRVIFAARRHFSGHMRLNEIIAALQTRVREEHLRRTVILDVKDIEITADIRLDHKTHGVSRPKLATGADAHRHVALPSLEERTAETNGPCGSRPILRLRL